MLTAFVAMPFHPDMDWVYQIIEDICKKHDVIPRRVDKIGGVDNIWFAIMEEIEKCDIFIADLSQDPCFKRYDFPPQVIKNSANSNVVTEAGYAMALKKNMIILSNNSDSLPFDFKIKLALIYSSDTQGRLFFQRTFENQIIAIQEKIYCGLYRNPYNYSLSFKLGNICLGRRGCL